MELKLLTSIYFKIISADLTQNYRSFKLGILNPKN